MTPSERADPVKRIEDALVQRGRLRRAIADVVRRLEDRGFTVELVEEYESRRRALDAVEGEVARLTARPG